MHQWLLKHGCWPKNLGALALSSSTSGTKVLAETAMIEDALVGIIIAANALLGRFEVNLVVPCDACTSRIDADGVDALTFPACRVTRTVISWFLGAGFAEKDGVVHGHGGNELSKA